MATPSHKLAQSLDVLRKRQATGGAAIQAKGYGRLA